MEEDIIELNAVMDIHFPKLTIGEKEDLIIRQWISYAEIHMKEHPCSKFREILRIRANQILELLL